MTGLPIRIPPPSLSDGGGGPPPKSGLPDFGYCKGRTRQQPSSVAVEGVSPRTALGIAPSTMLRMVPLPRFAGKDLQRGIDAAARSRDDQASALTFEPWQDRKQGNSWRA